MILARTRSIPAPVRMRTPLHRSHLRLALAALLLALSGCATHPACNFPGPDPGATVLLREDFEGENDNRYKLNYTGFAQWDVVEGTVDLVGTPPFDDFLPREQGMYVDLDGTSRAAGTLRTRMPLQLGPGVYRLEFKMSGTPRPNQPDNTMVVSLGSVFADTITLESYAPLQRYARTIRLRSCTDAHLTFRHLGGDDYGIFIDDIRLESR